MGGHEMDAGKALQIVNAQQTPADKHYGGITRPKPLFHGVYCHPGLSDKPEALLQLQRALAADDAVYHGEHPAYLFVVGPTRRSNFVRVRRSDFLIASYDRGLIPSYETIQAHFRGTKIAVMHSFLAVGGGAHGLPFQIKLLTSLGQGVTPHQDDFFFSRTCSTYHRCFG